MPAFDNSEYLARLDRLRVGMAARGMEALLVLSEANICYLTGYEGFSDYVPQAVLVTQSDLPLLILREMDVCCAAPTSWLPTERITCYPESFIGSPDCTPWEPIAALARGVCPPDRLGVEFTANGFGPKAYRSLCRALHAKELLDADGLVAACKRIKSKSEIAYIVQAGAIVDRAMMAGFERMADGVRQADVGAAIMHALVSGTEDHPGGPPRPPTMHVGRIANAPHLKWTDAPYRSGQQTNFELAAFRHRYACAVSRTAYLGSPPARLRHLHEAASTGFGAALGTMRPGVTSGEVDAAFRRAFAPFGVRKESRIGYSIGLDWPDGGATLQANDKLELQTGMVFHLIVGIWESVEGYVFSETIEITDQGGQSLSRLPRTILEKGA